MTTTTKGDLFPLSAGDIVHPPGASWNTFLVLDATEGAVKLLQCIGVRSEVSPCLLAGWEVKRRASDLRSKLRKATRP
jgi:hypothetical protein